MAPDPWQRRHPASGVVERGAFGCNAGRPWSALAISRPQSLAARQLAYNVQHGPTVAPIV